MKLFPAGRSGDGGGGGGGGSLATVRQWRPPKQQGAARLFNYMEASDGSDQDEYEGGKCYPPSDEQRSVQDFPEAGDVGSTASPNVGHTAERPPTATDHPTRTTIIASVTSPAQACKGPVKRKTPRKNKSGNKENKKSKSENSLKVADHGRQPNGPVRSPLLAANAAQCFVFDTESHWDLDENGRHRRRKQSQPKKVIKEDEEDMVKDSTVVSCKKPLVDLREPVTPMNQIDSIISKIVKKKEIEHDLSLYKPNDNLNSPKKVQTKKRRQSISLKSLFSNKSPLYKNQKLLKVLMNKLACKRANVVFKCKRCSLKFHRKFEMYLHSRKCKKYLREVS